MIAGPGQMKSTIVKECLMHFPNALTYSDLTLKQLAVIRSQIAGNVYTTLGFLELEKLYARNASVALNLEGVIKAMVEEGFCHFAFEDQRLWVPRARCFVMASVLESVYRFHGSRWTENGFLRRFILIKYMLSREAKQAMNDALHDNNRLPLPGILTMPSGVIPMNVTNEESRKLEAILDREDEASTPLNLIRKILAVLKYKWKEGHTRRELTPMECIEDLKDGLGRNGGILTL